MRHVKFTPDAFREYNEWIELDRGTFEKIKALIKDISRDPFKGLGKPEPLKGNYAGFREQANYTGTQTYLFYNN